jgi:hypothetical protein
MITSEKQLMNVLNNGLRGKYVYINAHSFERLNYDEILPKCKIILDLYGNGIKCFRNIESAVYGVSAKQDVSIVSHAYPWIDNDNCIMLPINKNNNLKLNQSINLLLSWLTENNQSKLYEIYKRGNKTVVNYEKDVYIKNYIHPKIHKDKVIR